MVRRLLLACALVLVVSPGVARAAPLTNTAHLDFLGDSVAPPVAGGPLDVRVGPDRRALDLRGPQRRRVVSPRRRRRRSTPRRTPMGRARSTPTTSRGRRSSTCAIGAPRARVASRTRAYALLRGLAYLQSPNGNVVLWMQPDGTLNPSAEPVELPDPSDSGPSYWLARTVWALRRGLPRVPARRSGICAAFSASAGPRVERVATATCCRSIRRPRSSTAATCRPG